MADLPSLAKCVTYALLRANQATATTNLAPGGAPLTVQNTPLYEPDCVVIDGTATFTTAESVTAFNHSKILVFSDAYQTMATPSVPTIATGGAGSKYMGTTAGGQYAGVLGAAILYRSGAGGQYDIQASGSNLTRDFPWYFPDGQVRRGRFAIMGLTSDGVTAKLYLQTGGRVQLLTFPQTAPLPTIAASPTLIGSGQSAGTRWRAAAFAQFSSALSDAEMFANMAVMSARVEELGTIDFSAFPKTA